MEGRIEAQRTFIAGKVNEFEITVIEVEFSGEGQFSGHNILLQAASQGAVLSDGPASTSFRNGNPECASSMEHEQEQRQVLRGRLEGNINRLGRQREVLVYRGQFDQADVVDAERAQFQYMLDEVNSR